MLCEKCDKKMPENLNYCPSCKFTELNSVTNIETETKLEIQNENITIKEKTQKTNIGLIIGIIIGFIMGFIAFVFIIYPILKPTTMIRKPIIYLYPTKETEVSIKLVNSNILTHTYPKYEKEWKVLAKPNGDLIDLKTNKYYYALYWEGINKVESNFTEGFVVKGSDTIDFLESKLNILGLNEREINEFIIYWLPELENNKYNFIRFQTIEEINQNMPLVITPKPDSLIRIMMEYKSLNKMLDVKEQILETPNRNGFAVVEWGGTKIK